MTSMSYDPKSFGQQAVNIELQKVIRAKQEGLNIAARSQASSGDESLSDRLDNAERRNVQLVRQLKEAQALVADWQSSMEAWKDLAQALREEIKACPNAEAHKYGNDRVAQVSRMKMKEDEERVKHGRPPRYAPAE
jgi:hypothetical protein